MVESTLTVEVTVVVVSVSGSYEMETVVVEYGPSKRLTASPA